MPATRPKRLFAPLLLPDAVATHLTATNVKIVLTSLLGCNTTGTARLVTIHLVPVGSTASATNTIVYQKTVLPGQTVEFLDRVKVMENGDFLAAFADAAAGVSFSGFGIETDV